jgi:hypothetical protein
MRRDHRRVYKLTSEGVRRARQHSQASVVVHNERGKVHIMAKHDDEKDKREDKAKEDGHKPGGPIPPPADPGKHGKK